MAAVRTFRMDPKYGIPDSAISNFISDFEQENGKTNVNIIFIPAYGRTTDGQKADPRVTVVLTAEEPEIHEGE